METLTSLKNPRVALWRSLKDHKARKETGLFLVEGRKMVSEALASRFDVETVQCDAAQDGVQDPGNVGTILRTADAAGFDGLLLSEQCADIFSPKVLRATMGSIFRMGVTVTPDLPGLLTHLREQGYSVISSQLDGTPFYQREGVAAQFVLVIGNEGNGVSPVVQATATHRLKLPMRGGAESLNAAVAAGIMMYELTREL